MTRKNKTILVQLLSRQTSLEKQKNFFRNKKKKRKLIGIKNNQDEIGNVVSWEVIKKF